MAVFTFASGLRVNSDDLTLTDIGDYAQFSDSAVELRFFDDALNFTSLLGTGLDATVFEGQLVDITAGNITGLSTFVEGVAFINVTGWNIDAPELFGLVAAGDEEGLRDLLLGGDDLITLSNRRDDVDAGGGNDELYGRRGSDNLSGGGGSDLISGGRGNDTMTGGKGADTFVFEDRLILSNADVITDFNVSVDLIFLKSSVFAGLGDAGEVVSSSRFVIGEPQDTSDRLIYDATSGALLYDADGTGAIAAIQFATLSAGLDLTAENFVLIG